MKNKYGQFLALGVLLNSLAFADEASTKTFDHAKATIKQELGKLKPEERSSLLNLFQDPALNPPRMTLADFYTASAGGEQGFVSKPAQERAVYHIAFRREGTPWMKEMGVKPDNVKFIFMGLSHIVDKLITPRVTQEEIDRADAFFKAYNRYWNKALWQKIVDTKEGRIPLKIEALPEGSVTFPGEPSIQITAEEGFGEMAAWFEASLLHVWAPSERATYVRYWLDYFESVAHQCLEKDKPYTDQQIFELAQGFMADMSSRSARTDEEGTELGLASLLSLKGATPAALYTAYVQNNFQPVGKLDVYSLAHRVVQGHETEGDAYQNLYQFLKEQKSKEGSFVADCYDYRKAVVQYLIPLAKKAQAEGNIEIFARPDSGDHYDQVLFALKEAVKANLHKTIVTKSGKTLYAMTALKVIQADGMNFKKVKEINDRLLKEGFSPLHCVKYGIGGSLNQISRDNMSAALKLAEIGSTHTPVMKFAIPAKQSIPGMVKIVRREDGLEPSVRSLNEAGENAYVVYYDAKLPNPMPYQENFISKQERALSQFKFHRPATLLSSAILEKVSQLREKHLGEG